MPIAHESLSFTELGRLLDQMPSPAEIPRLVHMHPDMWRALTVLVKVGPTPPTVMTWGLEIRKDTSLPRNGFEVHYADGSRKWHGSTPIEDSPQKGSNEN